jgi:hypothetical protein
MFLGKAGAYLSEAPFSCSTLGYATTSPANNKLGWNGWPGTNALAYYKNLELMTVKSFTTIGP